MKLKIQVPLKNVPSINHTYRSGINRKTGKLVFFKTKEAKWFQEWLQWYFKTNIKIFPSNKKISLSFDFFFASNKSDISNYVKMIEDAMEGIVYFNDKQIVKETLTKNIDKINPRVEITIEEVEDEKK